MTEPTPQELQLAALLHEAGDLGICWYDRDCDTGGKDSCGGAPEHVRQARALIALGVRAPEPVAPSLPPGHPDYSDLYLDTASSDWRDSR